MHRAAFTENKKNTPIGSRFMSYKTKIIISGLFITIIALAAYISLRMDIFEKQMAAKLKKQNERIIKTYQGAFEEKEIKTIQGNDLTLFLNKINKAIPDIALVIIADTDKTIRLSSKNDSIIQSDIYDKILHDFTGNNLRINRPGEFIIRYYTSGENQKEKNIKYYIFNNNMGTGSLVITFPHKPGKIIITRAALEITLIIIIIIIFCSVLYIMHDKKDVITEYAEKTADEQNKKILRKNIVNEERSIIRESLSLASEGLSSYVYNLFSEIFNKFHTKSLSLYIKSSENTMAKLFEYRGNSFMKIDSPVFDTLDLTSGIGRELKNGTPIILMAGKKAVLPLIHNDSLLGTLHVTTEEHISGDELDTITLMSASVRKELGDYLVLNNVMIDQSTGIYSETYFTMKYNEIVNKSVSKKHHFSLILVSIARNIKHLIETDQKAVIKVIAPILDEEIKDDKLIGHYDRFIAVLLPESDAGRSRKAADRIFKALSRLRIKISEQEHLDIVPFIGVASSEMTDDPRHVLDTAHKNIDLALTRDDGNIQNSAMKL